MNFMDKYFHNTKQILSIVLAVVMVAAGVVLVVVAVAMF